MTHHIIFKSYNHEAQRCECEDHEESSPLLQVNESNICSKGDTTKTAEEYGWTADGLPVSQGSVIGEPIGRNQWSSGLFSCLGRNDEFCSSDLEVCLLGSVAPCVLYGSNAERLGSAPGTFSNHCLTYLGLYFVGNSLFGWNCLAPCCIEDEMQREHMETTCDFVTHVLCHTCALCQEGREIRRKVLHPGFNAQSTVVVLPPSEQTMGRK
ncbi:hypothetical protein HID58_063067 [Brassica napus]|uniref:PLAC8 family protein n=1 Tax=Brassica napus TaxID=3708 RepID=A0ABQ8A497_BRANA|nr:hypothetical protein HID58_063067 [Brassica napus]